MASLSLGALAQGKAAPRQAGHYTSVLELNPEKAPKTVENFAVRQGQAL
jgi:hypothetical protein